MTLDQLLANLTDIKSTTQPPYYVGKNLARALQERCTGYRATTSLDGIDTAMYDGIDGLREVPFVLIEYQSEKGKVHELDNFFGNLSPNKILNEISIE